MSTISWSIAPRRRARGSAFFVLALALAAPAPRGAEAQAILPTGFSDQLIASGLNYPTSMTFLNDGRLLLTEKVDARVRLVVNDALVTAPVGTVDSVRQSSEAGLLGIAADPGFPARPYVYVYYDYLGAPAIRISRYTLTGDLAFAADGAMTMDPASRYDVMADIPDETPLHNAGMLRFGPDGMLYATVGDDQYSCDAVDVNALRGKLLRLDVSGLPAGPGGPPDKTLITPADNPFVSSPDPRARLVWAYGLRNPYSFHIDAPTGDVFLADVGASLYEEIDWATAPGLNFGWPIWEGPERSFRACTGDTVNLTFPIHAYDRTGFLFGSAVLSGGRYRRPASGGSRFPASYDGDYFFSDVGEGFLRRLKFDGSTWAIAPPVAGQPADSDWAHNMAGVTDYLMSADGALWYCKYAQCCFGPNTGEIRRIVASQALSVPGLAQSPVQFAAPYPSPTSGAVTFAYTLPAPARVRLSIHDLAGREVRRLVDDALESEAQHAEIWDGRDARERRVPPGIYLARLRVDGREQVRRFAVTR